MVEFRDLCIKSPHSSLIHNPSIIQPLKLAGMDSTDATSMNLGNVVAGPEKHSKFWFGDGNIVFQASCNTEPTTNELTYCSYYTHRLAASYFVCIEVYLSVTPLP